jgi:arabinose-5-phosphate isomerase
MPQPFDAIASARRVLLLESEAITQLAHRLVETPQSFEAAVQAIANCTGRVVVTGIGKSGAIGRKLASTLASTGTPALFVHAAEALHGDLGMVAQGDILIAISYSGRSDELLTILPAVKAAGVPVIALTGNASSYLATHADIVLDAEIEREACPLNLAPTSSTTAALALGDALAIALMEKRGFATADFKKFHPGGTLGRGANLFVADLMRIDDRIAICSEDATVRDSLSAITQASAGAAMIVDGNGVLIGYLTDGDVRRIVLSATDATELLKTNVKEFMTRSPMAFKPEMPALDALRRLQEKNLNDAPIVNKENKPVGWLDVHELIKAGLS